MLPIDGTLSLRDVATELSIVPNSLLSLDDTRVRNLARKLTGAISMTDLRGKANNLQLTIATSAKIENLYTQDGSACPGTVSVITTSDDSEITLEDVFIAMMSSTITPVEFPHVYCHITDGNIEMVLHYGNTNKNVILVPHTKYQSKTFTQVSGGSLTVYPKAGHTASSVVGYTVSTPYTKTGQYVQSTPDLIFIDNISKSNANLGITVAGIKYSNPISTIKNAVASLTDKKNAAVIVTHYATMEPSAWIFDLSYIRNVTSGIRGNGYAYTAANTRSGVIFQ